MLGLAIFVIFVVTATNAGFYKQQPFHRYFAHTFDTNGFHNGHMNHHYHHHQRFGPPPPFGGPPPMPFPFHHHHHHNHHNHYHGPHRNCKPGETFCMDSLYPNSMPIMPIMPYMPTAPVVPPINPYTIPINEFPSNLDHSTFPYNPDNPFLNPNQPNFGTDSTQNTVNNPVNNPSFNPFDQSFNQFFQNQFGGGGYPNTQQNTNINVGPDSTNSNTGPVNTTPNNFNTVTPLDANTVFDNQNGVQSSTAPTVEFITIGENEQNGNGGWFSIIEILCVCKNFMTFTAYNVCMSVNQSYTLMHYSKQCFQSN